MYVAASSTQPQTNQHHGQPFNKPKNLTNYTFFFCHFIPCSFIFFHVLSFSFILCHVLSFSFIFWHFLSFSLLLLFLFSLFLFFIFHFFIFILHFLFFIFLFSFFFFFFFFFFFVGCIVPRTPSSCDAHSHCRGSASVCARVDVGCEGEARGGRRSGRDETKEEKVKSWRSGKWVAPVGKLGWLTPDVPRTPDTQLPHLFSRCPFSSHMLCMCLWCLKDDATPESCTNHPAPHTLKVVCPAQLRQLTLDSTWRTCWPFFWRRRCLESSEETRCISRRAMHYVWLHRSVCNRPSTTWSSCTWWPQKIQKIVNQHNWKQVKTQSQMTNDLRHLAETCASMVCFTIRHRTSFTTYGIGTSTICFTMRPANLVTCGAGTPGFLHDASMNAHLHEHTTHKRVALISATLWTLCSRPTLADRPRLAQPPYPSARSRISSPPLAGWQTTFPHPAVHAENPNNSTTSCITLQQWHGERERSGNRIHHTLLAHVHGTQMSRTCAGRRPTELLAGESTECSALPPWPHRHVRLCFVRLAAQAATGDSRSPDHCWHHCCGCGTLNINDDKSKSSRDEEKRGALSADGELAQQDSSLLCWPWSSLCGTASAMESAPCEKAMFAMFPPSRMCCLSVLHKYWPSALFRSCCRRHQFRGEAFGSGEVVAPLFKPQTSLRFGE